MLQSDYPTSLNQTTHTVQSEPGAIRELVIARGGVESEYAAAAVILKTAIKLNYARYIR